jgi:hypothetical protein
MTRRGGQAADDTDVVVEAAILGRAVAAGVSPASSLMNSQPTRLPLQKMLNRG